MGESTDEQKRLETEEVVAFRYQYNDTFAVLCRMHLSFVLDLDQDGLAPLLEAESAKLNHRGSHKREPGEIARGTRLTFETACPMQRLIRHLQKSSNIREEGVFRKSGSVIRQQSLKVLLRRNAILDFEANGYNVHDCACTLKSMLLDLAEPLLTNAHFAAYCRIPGLYKEKSLPSIRAQCHQRQIKAAQLLLLLLPTVNYNLVKDLLLLLHEVSKARQENCMSSRSLATLFTPIILCPRQMSLDQMHYNYTNNTKPVMFLIENAPLLFDYPEELVKDIVMHAARFRTGEAVLFDQDAEPVTTSVRFCVQQENAEPVEQYTERALAELYDYVYGMPDTMQQKKYFKQVLGKENRGATALKKQKHRRSRTVDSGVKEVSPKTTPGSFKHKYLQRSTSSGNIKVLGAKAVKEKVPSTVNSPWQFLRRRWGESKDSCDASPVAKPEHKTRTPIRSTVLRASRRFKKAMKTQKNCRNQEL